MKCSIITEEKFNALSHKEQRIALAKDVIAQLNASAIKAESGTYSQYQSGKCFACAKGALFLSRFNIREVVNHTVPYDESNLRHYFSQEQMDLIETAFERAYYGVYDDWNCTSQIQKDADDALAFGRMFKKDHDRLMAVMENIIENDGEFKPCKDLPHDPVQS